MASSLTALSKLRENKTVYLRPVQSAEWEKSRVEAVLGQYLQVAHPMAKGRLRAVPSGENMEIGFSEGGDFYTFFSVVLEVRRRPVPLLVLQRPTDSELVHVQRRRSPRVDSLVPLSYEILVGGSLNSIRHTLALNVSSTGLSFNGPEPISPGSPLRLELQLPNVTGSISASGEVVSCSKVLHSKEERYKIRVHFHSIAQTHRFRINDFVMQKRSSQKDLE